jgi:hypothetical protein
MISLPDETAFISQLSVQCVFSHTKAPQYFPYCCQSLIWFWLKYTHTCAMCIHIYIYYRMDPKTWVIRAFQEEILNCCGQKFEIACCEQMPNLIVCLAASAVQQRTQFATSSYRQRVQDAIDFRNRFAQAPFLCQELIEPQCLIVSMLIEPQCLIVSIRIRRYILQHLTEWTILLMSSPQKFLVWNNVKDGSRSIQRCVYRPWVLLMHAFFQRFTANFLIERYTRALP